MNNFRSSFSKAILDFLAVRSVSVNQDTYRRDVRNLHIFDDYFFEHHEGQNLFDHDRIINWQISLQHEHGMKSQINTIRLFLQFYSATINKKVYLPKCKINNNSFVPYIFTDDEIKKIIEYTDNYEKQEYFENSMILRILYGSGLRLNEALSLKMKDYLIESGTLFLRKTKFNKERLVPMHSSLSAILEKYCYRRDLIGKSDAYIFPANNKTGHISRNTIISSFKNALKYAGVNQDSLPLYERGPCFHSLRHVFTMKACNKLELEGFSVYDSIPYISFYLGHNSIFETEKYLNFGSEMFPLELQKFESQSASLFPEVKDDI